MPNDTGAPEKGFGHNWYTEGWPRWSVAKGGGG